MFCSSARHAGCICVGPTEPCSFGSIVAVLASLTLVRPETVVRWHRMGFAAYWRWKSRPLGGRPRIGKEVRDLIRRMSFENPLWGASKIHGELLKLGIEVAQSTVSIYMVPRQDRPLQTWKTFLRNHAEGIASIDLFVVPAIAFEQLFAFLVLGHGRRLLLWIAVTRNPTAEWLARQITEAFPWERAPKYLIRDNDRALSLLLHARGGHSILRSHLACPQTAERESWLSQHWSYRNGSACAAVGRDAGSCATFCGRLNRPVQLRRWGQPAAWRCPTSRSSRASPPASRRRQWRDRRPR
jgi:hypothetical protein